MTTTTKQALEARIKEINREICRVDATQVKMLMKELRSIEKKLGYTLDALWS